MFSPELSRKVNHDLNCLNQRIHLTRTFENLYEQSHLFHTFQSYVQFRSLIQYVYETKSDEQQLPNLDAYANELTSYSDLRICQCADYVLTVYVKLVEYHTNLYEMYEKLVDDKRDSLRRKEFDRIIYYRSEICQLLLRANCFQRLLVEIDNGRKFLKKFQDDPSLQENSVSNYQYLLTKYTFNLFEAIVLQRTRSIFDAKFLCEQSLVELKEMNEKYPGEQLGTQTNATSESSAKEKRAQFEHSRDYLLESSTSFQTVVSELIFDKLEYERE